MSSENTIHIKLEYEEALQAKRDILALQIALLKMAKTIRGYKSYRSDENESKISFLKKIGEAKSNIGKIKKDLPKPKIPGILKKDEYVEKKEKKTKAKHTQGDLEEQLHEIQRRLKELQNR